MRDIIYAEWSHVSRFILKIGKIKSKGVENNRNNYKIFQFSRICESEQTYGLFSTTFQLFFYKEDGKSITGSSIIKKILGILFEGFLNIILSVSWLKSEGRCPFFNNEVSVILDKFSSYLCVLLLFTTYNENIYAYSHQ